MVLKNEFEFRGSHVRISKKGVEHLFVSLEDPDGQSFTLWCDSGVPVSNFEKGDLVTAVFDFDTRYSSIKCIGLEAS